MRARDMHPATAPGPGDLDHGPSSCMGGACPHDHGDENVTPAGRDGACGACEGAGGWPLWDGWGRCAACGGTGREGGGS